MRKKKKGFLIVIGILLVGAAPEHEMTVQAETPFKESLISMWEQVKETADTCWVQGEDGVLLYEEISSFETFSDSETDRNENLRLACEAIDGMVLEPEETFSFNEATGERTIEKGYRPARAYASGKEILDVGGGICQVATSLYNAVVQAGLESIQRAAHSVMPEYAEPGEDAAVSFGGPDFKFRNNSGYPVKLRAAADEGDVRVSVWGIPILEEGETLAMESIETSPNNWLTYLVRFEDGEEVERNNFHTSRYYR